LPVPYKVLFCTPFPALSLTFVVPENEPVVGGEKLTATVHDAPGANEAPQVVPTGSMPKLLLLVAMPLITTVVLEPTTEGLLLVTVSNLSALVVPCITMPNWIAGVTESGASVPLPFSVIEAGSLLALLVMLTVPVRVPCAIGLKVTPTVQLAPPANTVEPTRLHGVPPTGVSAKSPDEVILVTVSPTELGLVIVPVPTVALVVPTWVFGNARLGEKLILPFTPLAVPVITLGVLSAVEGMLTLPV
jgi:hypothetical protein